jgi:hypothetical protein
MSSVANAEWILVTRDKLFNNYYVDFKRIRKHDGKVYYWELGELSQATKNGLKSARIYIEAECERFRFRYLNQTYYNDIMGSGEVISSNNTPDKEWNYPPPNSSREIILEFVCNFQNTQ